MADFLHLITVVAHHFYEFISLDDVVNLDYACINKAARKQLHISLERVSFQELEFECTSSGLKFESDSSQWILQRGLSPAHVYISSEMTDANMEELIKLPLRVSKLKLSDNKIDNKHLNNLYDLCPNLSELTIQSPSASIQELTNILNRCRRVHTINLVDCQRMMDNGALVKIVELCPHVQSLHLSHLYLARESHFRQLATLCQLREIHWQGSLVEHTPGFGAFASHCPPTLEVVDLENISFAGRALSNLLHRSPRLRELHLRDCLADNPSAALITTALSLCSELEVLRVYGCAWFNGDCLQLLVTGSKLRCLSYLRCFHATLESLSNAMVRFPNLQELELSMMLFVSCCAPLLHALTLHCTQLTSFKLTCAGLNQQHYLDLLLKRCTQLKTLELTYLSAPIELDGECLHNVQHLNLVSALDISDKTLLSIVSNCSKLRTVSLITSSKVWSNVEIVRAIGSHCPFMRVLCIKRCTDAFQRAFNELRARGMYRLRLDCLAVVKTGCSIQ